VRAVNLVTFTLSNVGNVPVLEDDFERALRLQFPGSAVPLTVEIEEAHPRQLRPAANIEGAGVVVERLLLNPGDSFTIAALVRDLRRGAISVDARVAGVARLGSGQAHASNRERRSGYLIGRLWASSYALSGALAVATAGLVIGLVSAYVDATRKEHSRVTRTDRRVLCGKVLRVDADRIVVQVKDSGRVEVLPLTRVMSIEDNAC
jgi:hypothetical protein